ncbi:MAG: dihydrodipicolinate synthase family protein [Pirellulales bacterium]|nr:dihydrodipicolinate synthase family protein [Pirellulales bacterium]
MVVAIIAPCLPSGEVDPPAMRRLCRILAHQGCHGIFVVGSTGEMPYLDEDDRRALTAAAREGLEETETILYVGTSGLGLKQTIRYTQNAAQDGADVAVIMAPMIFKFSQTELAAYTRAVADASPIPLAIYHHLRMPTTFEVETIAELAQHPNIVAIKDTSKDLTRLGSLIDATAGTDLTIFQGCEHLFLDSLKIGAAGCVSALANVAPEWHVALHRSFQSGNFTEAEIHQRQLSALCQIFHHELLTSSFSYFTYALKRILQHRGWLEHVHGLMPGFKPAAEFDEVVLDYIRVMEL